jgi:hypothetical protein
MKAQYLRFCICFCFCFVMTSGCKDGTIPKVDESNDIATFSFIPNQIAASSWYKPGNPPTLINGHLDDSFGQKDLWPNLITNLKNSHGSFSIFAAEIGCMSSTKGLIPLLKAEGIPISVEMPGFTQCIDGTLLGKAELNGEAIDGTNNIFSSIFRISNPTDRTDPDGKGWFVTKDRKPFIPDEILFDERMPNLLPQFDPAILASTVGTWEYRKNAAKKSNGCEVSTISYNELLSTLRQDYVEFLTVAKAKWGNEMPAVSIHWNVVAGWEWRDQKGLDDINAINPNYFNVANNYWGIITNYPQYNSVLYLNDLIEVLTAAGFKPKTILMDVDWTYNIPYITEILKRHKIALKSKGVQMGINIVEASLNDIEELYYNGFTLLKRANSSATPNELYENTLIAIVQFLKGSGIYEKGMHIRVGSWSHRPYETGTQVNENTPGSIAHTSNEIFKSL